jgi:AAA family ATP:ADP antiporter
MRIARPCGREHLRTGSSTASLRSPTAFATSPGRFSPLERWLSPFTEIRPGEGPAGVSLLVGVFLVLAAYYFVKPARDGLLAVSPAGGLSETELKAYSSLGQSLCLFAALPLYDELSRRLSRRTLVCCVTLFFAANLVVFWALQPGLLFHKVGYLGVIFYLWVGIFNVFIVAQFWSFANDLYTDEHGKRLFPVIALGATAGAAAGAGMAKVLVPLVGTYGLLLVAAGLLSSSLVAMLVAENVGAEGVGTSAGGGPPETRDDSGGLSLVFRHEYLLATAILVLVLNWVNTNGENLLFGAVESHLQAEAASRGIAGTRMEAFIRDQTTHFYGDFFFWVNSTALFLQAFVASRLLRFGGFAAILLVLPVISLAAYALMAIHPALGTIRRMKIAENATDYSLNNTAKQVLWLPTTVDMKYRAKAAIDTLFVRAGDVLAALTAFVGIEVLGASLRLLFAFNALLALGWLVLAARIGYLHEQLPRAGRHRPTS